MFIFSKKNKNKFIKQSYEMCLQMLPSQQDCEWKVHDDLCGSDHFPIFLKHRVTAGRTDY